MFLWFALGVLAAVGLGIYKLYKDKEITVGDIAKSALLAITGPIGLLIMFVAGVFALVEYIDDNSYETVITKAEIEKFWKSFKEKSRNEGSKVAE